MNESDGSLLSPELFMRFQAGDPQAMKAIVELYRKRLIGFIRLFTWSREVAEEIAQEVFLTTYQDRRKIIGPDKVRPWLFIIARRKISREMSKGQYRAEITVETEALCQLALEVPPKQVSGLQLQELGLRLRRALDKLRPKEREVLMLRFFGDLQIKEIAAVMDMPMGSVGVHISRALSKIRKHLEEEGLGFEDLVS